MVSSHSSATQSGSMCSLVCVAKEKLVKKNEVPAEDGNPLSFCSSMHL